jgi:hypothetical protein
MLEIMAKIWLEGERVREGLKCPDDQIRIRWQIEGEGRLRKKVRAERHDARSIRGRLGGFRLLGCREGGARTDLRMLIR